MPTISLSRLRELLRTYQLELDDPLFMGLIAALELRDQFMDSADAVETLMIRRIGLPRIVVATADGPVFVADVPTLLVLSADLRLPETETDRLIRRLERRHRQWWSQASEIGLRGLRRRERHAAIKSANLVRHFLRRPSPKIATIAAKVALLAAQADDAGPSYVWVLNDVLALGERCQQHISQEPRLSGPRMVPQHLPKPSLIDDGARLL